MTSRTATGAIKKPAHASRVWPTVVRFRAIAARPRPIRCALCPAIDFQLRAARRGERLANRRSDDRHFDNHTRVFSKTPQAPARRVCRHPPQRFSRRRALVQHPPPRRSHPRVRWDDAQTPSVAVRVRRRARGGGARRARRPRARPRGPARVRRVPPPRVPRGGHAARPANVDVRPHEAQHARAVRADVGVEQPGEAPRARALGRAVSRRVRRARRDARRRRRRRRGRRG